MNNENDKEKSAPVDTVKPVVMLKCMRCGVEVHPDKAWSVLTINAEKGNGRRTLCGECHELEDSDA